MYSNDLSSQDNIDHSMCAKVFITKLLREAEKISLFSGPATKRGRGGGGKGRATKKKVFF